MFGPRYFGPRHYGRRFWGVGATATAAPGTYWGGRYFGALYWGARYWPGGAPATPATPAPRPSVSCGTDLMERGMIFLADQLHAFNSQPVIVARDGELLEVCAVFGSKMLRVADGDGNVRYEHTDLDFKIRGPEYVFGGSRTTPRRGDLVYVATEDQTLTYEVFPYNGEPAWRWCDPYHRMMRVHAKLVDEEAYP